MNSIPLLVPCLEELSTMEERCRQLGLSINLDTYTEEQSPAPVTADDFVVSNAQYEVETICDYKFENDTHWYLVKWKGWSPKANTWEPKEHLVKCSAKLKQFREQWDKLSLDGSKIVRKHEIRPGISKAKKELEKRLKAWETEINSVSSNEALLIVINDVDLEGPPTDFIYTNDYIAGEGIIIPNDPLVGCDCEPSCIKYKDHCCGHMSGSEFAYNRYRRVRLPAGSPIYECNKRCKCGVDCVNRVVQHGRNIKLAIFRTANGRGWGVQALQAINKNTYVMEYVGEVITNEEAERRGKIYDAQGRTYLFDLDYNGDDCPFTVDAAHYGNASHFMNHSCEPNLAVYGVWINALDPRLPRIAFFTTRDVNYGEELTFDYRMSGATILSPSGKVQPVTPGSTFESSLKPIRCKCGSKSCRKYLF